MKIAILGGSGFIGKNLIQRLSSENHSLILLSRTPSDLPVIKNIVGDWREPKILEALLDQVDFVYHLLTATHPALPNQNLANDLSENVVPSVQLLDFCCKAKVKKICYLSSAGTIYGNPHIVPIPETHSLHPISPYGMSKLFIEDYLRFYHQQFALDYTAVRLTNPYGPGQDFQQGLGAITNFIEKTLKGIPLEIWGDGSTRRDYIYIADVVDALTKLLTVPSKSQVYNLGTGHGISLKELISLLESKMGQKINVIYKEKRGIDVPDNTVDIKLIKKELSWSPQFTIEQGLDKYLSYYKSKGSSL